MATTYESPSEYIKHHLTFNVSQVGDSAFHLDSVVTSIILGIIGIGFMWLITRKATTGVPSKTQAFVELSIGFVNEQVKGMYHGTSKWVAPIALTVFVWTTLMNAMDFLPVDIMATIYGWFGIHQWRSVPTADVNTTFALALVVFGLMVLFGIKAKGLGGWTKELFVAPFGANPILWPFNFLFNLIEFISKPLSHSLRLYGNIYAGEIIFLLLGMWAASGLAGTIFSGVLNLGWAIFHILIVLLQAYIFMMLTIVYLAMAEESH
ncbi:MAG: F0F1 ATP synthase subunit A [Burkholderiales bacterium]|nr:F0F1 ATP synthase subunit A [Burkholderiales bacterium]